MSPEEIEAWAKPHREAAAREGISLRDLARWRHFLTLDRTTDHYHRATAILAWQTALADLRDNPIVRRKP